MKISIAQSYQWRCFYLDTKRRICQWERCIRSSCLTASMSLRPAVICLRFPLSAVLMDMLCQDYCDFLLKSCQGGIRITVKMTVFHIYLTTCIHCHRVCKVIALKVGKVVALKWPSVISALYICSKLLNFGFSRVFFPLNYNVQWNIISLVIISICCGSA